MITNIICHKGFALFNLFLQKEEQDRQNKIKDWDGHQQGKGYRSKYRPSVSSALHVFTLLLIWMAYV